MVGNLFYFLVLCFFAHWSLCESAALELTLLLTITWPTRECRPTFGAYVALLLSRVQLGMLLLCMCEFEIVRVARSCHSLG
eukprot:2686565-Amphidinium_carterae.1